MVLVKTVDSFSHTAGTRKLYLTLNWSFDSYVIIEKTDYSVHACRWRYDYGGFVHLLYTHASQKEEYCKNVHSFSNLKREYVVYFSLRKKSIITFEKIVIKEVW